MNKSIEKFFFKPESLEDIIHNADVVFDTNALLSAYQWKDAVFHEVLEALKKLSDANRLKIPAQVFKEFIHQRPLKITEAIDQIDLLIGSIQNPKKLGSVLPLLGLIDTDNIYAESESSYSISREQYKEDLKQLKRDLRNLFNDDIVLDSLKPYFENIDFSINFEDKELLKCAEDRAKAKIPPLTGGDGGKAENKYGDFFVWHYILSLNTDVIFVTTDAKEDWFYKSGAGKEKKPVSPRRELIEEFYEVSEGKTICIVSLQEFMQKYNPGLGEEIVENLMVVEKNRRITYEMICRAIKDVSVEAVYDEADERLDFLRLNYELSVRGFANDSVRFKFKNGDFFRIFIDLNDNVDLDNLVRFISEKNSLFEVGSARELLL